MTQQSRKINESKDFGKYAIQYAAGKDIILDKVLVQNEIKINQAHVVMLAKQKMISSEHVKKILQSLEKLQILDLAGNRQMNPELEDVHSNVENFVTNETGVDTSGNLKLGIARNDQIYTSTRMYIRDKILLIQILLVDLISIFLKHANVHKETLMPGYTHLRSSQPITYTHWLLAKAYYFLDDIENLSNTYKQINKSPLGVVQMAGTHLPIDRKLTANLLGFDDISLHTQYTAGLRGEQEIKLISDLSLLAVHIRRNINEIITFSGIEFGMMEIDDMYTTGGTGQPNLKNPDTLEIVRANCSIIYGKLFQSISMMDMLPSGNNRDCQQTKPALMDSINEIVDMLPIYMGVIDTITINEKRMSELAHLNYGTAPDICMELAQKGGCSFREIYKVIKYILKKTHLLTTMSDLTKEMIEKYSEQELSKKISISQSDIDFICNVKNVVLARNSDGATSSEQSSIMIKDIQNKISLIEKDINSKNEKIQKGYDTLTKEIEKIIG